MKKSKLISTKTLLRMAARNLRRNARRNGFTLASIASGLGILFWMQSILYGHSRNMIEIATQTYTGDIQIYRQTYLEDRGLQKAYGQDEVTEALGRTTSAPYGRRVHFPVILSSGEDSSPANLIGIEPEKEALITTLQQNVVEGEFLPNAGASCEEKQILLSVAAGKKLGVGVGEKVVIMGQAADGTLGNDLFRVSGLYSTGSTDFDRGHAFALLPCVQRISAMEGKIHEVVMNLPRGEDELLLQGRLGRELPGTLQVTTWREAVPQLAMMTRFHDAMVNVISIIFFLVITLGVVNSMLMNIFERMKEFGVMLALGTTPLQVKRLILLEAAMLGVLAAAVGTLIGAVLVGYYAKFGFNIEPFVGQGKSFVGFKIRPLIFPTFEWSIYLKLLVLELVFVLAAGVYPAFRAARLDPAEILRN